MSYDTEIQIVLSRHIGNPQNPAQIAEEIPGATEEEIATSCVRLRETGLLSRMGSSAGWARYYLRTKRET